MPAVPGGCRCAATGVTTIDAVVRTTARALVYLASGLVAGVAGFVWSVPATICVGLLSVTHLGGPAFLGAAWVTTRTGLGPEITASI